MARTAFITLLHPQGLRYPVFLPTVPSRLCLKSLRKILQHIVDMFRTHGQANRVEFDPMLRQFFRAQLAVRGGCRMNQQQLCRSLYSMVAFICRTSIHNDMLFVYIFMALTNISPFVNMQRQAIEPIDPDWIRRHKLVPARVLYSVRRRLLAYHTQKACPGGMIPRSAAISGVVLSNPILMYYNIQVYFPKNLVRCRFAAGCT